MKKKDFYEFYNNVIQKYIDEFLDEDKRSGYNCLTFRKNKVRNIYIYYEKKRLEIRKYFMNLESKPMDRHKIAAVMMYSILKSKVIKVNKFIPNLPSVLLMANEYLAFIVALGIIESYRKDQFKDNSKNNNCYMLNLPTPYHGVSNHNASDCNNDIYITNTCKSLYYLTNWRKFDIFAYSNILFLLEKYTDLYNKRTIDDSTANTK